MQRLKINITSEIGKLKYVEVVVLDV